MTYGLLIHVLVSPLAQAVQDEEAFQESKFVQAC
jgi:hypothetical protein